MVHGFLGLGTEIFAANKEEDGRFLGGFGAENFQLALMDKITFLLCKIHP